MKLNNNAKHKPPKTETLSKAVSVWKFQPAHKKLSKNFAVFLDLQAIEGHKYNGRPTLLAHARAICVLEYAQKAIFHLHLVGIVCILFC